MKEFTNETRALLAFVLSLLVLMVWSRFYKPATPPEKPAQTQAAPQAVTKTNQPASVAAATATPATVAPKAEAQEKTIVIESDLYRVELSNRGGVVRSWQLKKYTDDQKPPRTLDLVNAKAAEQVGGWPFSLTLGDPQLEAAANGGLYQILPATETTLRAPAQVTLEWSDGHLAVTKLLKFDTSYVVELETSVTRDGNPLPAAVAWRGGFGDTTAFQAALQMNVFYSAGGKLNIIPQKKLGAADHTELPALQTGPLDYAGIEDKFFAAAFLPNEPGLQILHWANQRDVVVEDKPAKEIVAQMAAGTSSAGPFDVRVYVGPKDLTQLNSLKPPLEDLVQFGWLGVISKPLLEILKWIYQKIVPNYGWAIVLVTLAINMALFPLKVKSWRSMQKMQKVAPEVESLKQKYAKYSMTDPRKRQMNEEMMAIYQREGINPMGSCLPMLLQFPIWIAFYRMLGSTIELRHAPWILWIHDLSGRDPYFILTILMALTMWLMQKMTPQTITDPAQQKMLAFMPLMFAGMFLFFPVSVGLVLYILTSNLVGIGQQWYLNRTDPLPAKGRSIKKR